MTRRASTSSSRRRNDDQEPVVRGSWFVVRRWQRHGERRTKNVERTTNAERRTTNGAMKILFAGIIPGYPFGGVTWCSLMYLLGLRALGHEVFYIEDTGECVYDPVLNTRATDPRYGTTYIHDALEPFGLGDRWTFVNYDGSYHGRSAEDVREYCA